MNTGTQANKLTIDDMAHELMTNGTVCGCHTIEEIEEQRIGLILFIQEEIADKRSPWRELAGIALSRGITVKQLKKDLHDELIVRLRDHLQQSADDANLKDRYSLLF